MTAAITFLFPAILYGAAAAAAPVLIHLILRTKPRRLVFPALRFVRKTHRATLKMLRLKHLILLLLRMAAVAAAALLIARARIPAWAGVEEQAVPAAAAIVIDNSGSMNYRYRGQSLLALAKQQAQRVIESLPKGSRVAVIATVGDRTPGLLDPSLAAQQVADLPATFRRATVAAALLQGSDLVQRDERVRKEVYLLTDLTAASWRDEVRLAGRKGTDYAILKCGGEDLNALLGDLRLSGNSVPVGAEVRVETSLAGMNVGGDMVVETILDGEAVAQQTVALPAGGAAPFSTTVRPRREGVVHGQVVLKNPDPLEMDNTRHFTLLVGPPAKVLVVVGTAGGDLTGFVMGNAVAPGATGSSAGSGGLQRETISSEQLDAGRLQGARVVLLAGAASVSETQWRLLEPFVRAGGAAWVVAGPMMSEASYNAPAARQLMPAALGAVEELPPPAGGRGADPRRWIVPDRAHPMLQPFEGESNPPLSEVLCRWRFRLDSQAADAQAVVEYADKTPAILLRRVGEGAVVFWNFSPLPGLSNLSRLEQLPILAMRTAAVLAADPSAQTSYVCGESVVLAIPRSLPGALVTLRSPGARGDRPLMPDVRRGVVVIPADVPGDYDVRFAEAGRQVNLGFSVNAEAAESDLRPLDPATLAARFPPGLMIVSDASELAQRRSAATAPLDLTPALLLALLALMTGESYFANRFYRQAQATAAS